MLIGLDANRYQLYHCKNENCFQNHHQLSHLKQIDTNFIILGYSIQQEYLDTLIMTNGACCLTWSEINRKKHSKWDRKNIILWKMHLCMQKRLRFIKQKKIPKYTQRIAFQIAIVKWNQIQIVIRRLLFQLNRKNSIQSKFSLIQQD